MRYEFALFRSLLHNKSTTLCNWPRPHQMKFKHIREDFLGGGERGAGAKKKKKSEKVIRSRKSLSEDVKLELKWQIKQHFYFPDNTTVPGPDFQTDIKFVPEW